MVEGVNYNINWQAFRRGRSIFIPCLNYVQAGKVIRQTTRRLRLKILVKVVIEDGIRGLRIWRM